MADIKKYISKINIKIPKTKKSKAPVSLRTIKDELRYSRSKKKRKGPIKHLKDEERIKTWRYWTLIDNHFPYTAAFKIHHMLIPLRVTTSQKLESREKAELEKILDELSKDYDCYLVNFQSKQSIQTHYHIHMLTYKESRKDLKF